MNKITLIGNLTANPEMRTTTSGSTVCSFNLAVNRKKTSEPQTDFFRINAWQKLGETCGRYLEKGKKVAVVGELQARVFEDKNGKTRLSLDVSADEVEFLSPKQEQKAEAATVSQGKITDTFTDISSDDLPF